MHGGFLTKTPALPPAVPEIPVADLAAAASYYRDCMGFTVDWLDVDLGLGGISRNDCRLFLAGPQFRAGRDNVAPVVTWLNMSSTADVDALHRGWQAAGAIVLSPPESKPWGLHEFTAADRDGNLFRVFHDFATPERERAAARGGSN